MSARSIRLFSAASATLILTACSATDEVPTGVEASQAIAGLNEAAAPVAGTKIPDRYIVVFTDEVGNPAAEAAAMMRGRGGEIHFTYEHAIKGFAATMPAAAVEAIARNPKVAYVEQDAVVTTTAEQTGATWGLDRIDQRALPLGGTYVYGSTGSGVRSYIIDTGILSGHAEFSGRMATGYSAISDGRGTTDCNGHGTHVAGTVGGTVYGVAKGTTLVPVRVLDCSGSGSWSGVIAGVDWVTGEKTSGAFPSTPMVGNMSLGGGVSSTVDAAVARAVSAGVVMVVAAGNSNANACNYSPAREASAVTVGATTSGDARASYSNFGSCLDLFAPGSSITSAWYTSTSATNTISGTSMASPHVAGAATLIAGAKPTWTVKQVTDSLIASASTGLVTSAGTGSPNRLLYTGTIAAPPPVTYAAPSNLRATTVKSKNVTTITLTWTSGGAPSFDLSHRGVSSTSYTFAGNTATTTFKQSWRGSATLVYRVCNVGTTTCSADVPVTF